MYADIYRAQTTKPLSEFLLDFASAAAKLGFFIQNETRMDVSQLCWRHSVRMPNDFDLHMIQVCKPAKMAESLKRNPERAILLPKFVVAFTRGGKTEIRLLRYSRDFVADLLDDPDFPDSLADSFNDLVVMIQEAIKPRPVLGERCESDPCSQNA